MKVAAAVSTDSDPARGAVRAARDVAAGLAGEDADIALVFAGGAHLSSPERTLAAIASELTAESLIGCGAGGVLGSGREYESGTAVAVWAAALDDGCTAEALHATVSERGGAGVLEGIPELSSDSGLILLSDPYTFPTGPVLDRIAQDTPWVPVLGGLASGRAAGGDGALLLGDQVCAEGAVGLHLRNVEMLPCVSQGAAPLGREMTVTAAEGNVIHELAGKPAVTTIESVIGELSLAERALVAGGLLIGIVIDGGKPEYEQGDFLVRGVIGVDSEQGSIQVGANMSVGQVVRLHARDARSAEADLRRELSLCASAAGEEAPAGALVFSCNGRGRQMFGVGDHDAAAIDQLLGGAPSAGFFAAGEIGPVGGRSLLHTFTATVAVFPG
ncbi:MAG TPA: FIST N-terminal domain-containing protein [Solirubrobacteraceae bacterium]|nr:FIST N-terminal domain-containing protein [Solirubrobacteraceae bacterium]